MVIYPARVPPSRKRWAWISSGDHVYEKRDHHIHHLCDAVYSAIRELDKRDMQFALPSIHLYREMKKRLLAIDKLCAIDKLFSQSKHLTPRLKQVLKLLDTYEFLVRPGYFKRKFSNPATNQQKKEACENLKQELIEFRKDIFGCFRLNRG